MERPSGLPELRSGFKGYCVLCQLSEVREGSVKIYSRSSPDVGKRLIALFPDFRETDLDGPSRI